MPKPRSKRFYDEISNALMNHLRDEYPNILFQKAGSRVNGDYQRTSDLDIRFYFSNEKRNKLELYNEMLSILRKRFKSFKGESIAYSLGTSRNVIKIRPVNGGKIDLVYYIE